MQAENVLNPNLSETQRARWRKIAHCVIAVSSLGVSAKAGVDLSLGHESEQHAAAIYTAGASLALNAFMLMRLRSGLKRRDTRQVSAHEQDLSKHFWAIDIPSAGIALTGSILQKYDIGSIEQAAALVSGLIGTFAFRPTRANLAHTHEVGARRAGEHRGRYTRWRNDKRSWRERIAYQPRHIRSQA
ncbi:MAG: hypothetical protein AAB834_05595 [Patescibacteria group bacterium]|mgnify:FL=1